MSAKMMTAAGAMAWDKERAVDPMVLKNMDIAMTQEKPKSKNTKKCSGVLLKLVMK